MKLGSSLFTSSLALAAVALSSIAFTPAARAYEWNGLTAERGDIFLGFRSAQTSGNSVVVNVGSVSDLLAQAADALAVGQTSIYIGNIGAALNSAYSPGTKVYWTATGLGPVAEDGSLTVYTGISWVSTTAHQTTARNIPTSKNVGSASGGYYPSPFNPIGSSNNSYFTTAGAVTYTDTGLAIVTAPYLPADGSASYGQTLAARTLGQGFSNTTTTGYTVTTGEANLTVNGDGYNFTNGFNIDLYAILPDVGGSNNATRATLLGWFDIDATGNLSFTLNASPVPEPATYAALFGGLSLAVAALRRRRA